MQIARQASKGQMAITLLITDAPFFASVILQHDLQEDMMIPTACVNVRGEIRYNPMWFETMTVEECAFVLAHECMHYMWMHMARRNGRDPRQWNIAGDGVINETLIATGLFKMPDEGVRWPGAEDKNTEQVFREMFEEGNEPPPQAEGPQGRPCPEGDSGEGQGQGSGDSKSEDDSGSSGTGSQGSDDGSSPPAPGGWGIGDDLDETGTEHLTEEEQRQLLEQVRVEVTQARNAARQIGKMPAILERLVEEITHTDTPWPEYLQQFYSASAENDCTYEKLDRRYISQGIYMPWYTGEGMGESAIIVDVSGSVSDRELGVFNGEFNGIMDMCKPDKLHLIYCHARVVESAVKTYEPHDYPIEMSIPETGGTDMTKGLDYVLQHFPQVESIVVLTDGYTPFGDEIDIPVLWAITTDVVAPWGETIHINLQEQ